MTLIYLSNVGLVWLSSKYLGLMGTSPYGLMKGLVCNNIISKIENKWLVLIVNLRELV
jgi:hypothetical protein